MPRKCLSKTGCFIVQVLYLHIIRVHSLLVLTQIYDRAICTHTDDIDRKRSGETQRTCRNKSTNKMIIYKSSKPYKVGSTGRNIQEKYTEI